MQSVGRVFHFLLPSFQELLFCIVVDLSAFVSGELCDQSHGLLGVRYEVVPSTTVLPYAIGDHYEARLLPLPATGRLASKSGDCEVQ